MTASRTVLVVDDDRVNRMVLTRAVRAAGFATQEAVDGADGVRAALSGVAVAILMDIMMPVWDGYEAIRRIRLWERDAGRSTPIIAVTALTDAATRRACLEAGADFYLPKPVDLTALQGALATYALATPPPPILAPLTGAIDGPPGQRALEHAAAALSLVDAPPSRAAQARADLRAYLVAWGATRALRCLDGHASPSDLAAEVRAAAVAATTPCTG